jgi:nitrate reductase delta subunit
MDEVWAEPEAFGGCSTQGQSKPGNLRDGQPLHFVRNARTERAPQGVSA